MNLKNRVQKFYTYLTDNDLKIAKYIIDNKVNLFDKRITELSTKIQVSPASITRFCHRIGFKSFQEMKFTVGERESPVDKSATGVIESIYDYYQMVIKSTQQFITEEQSNKIVDLIVNSNKVIFCGIGNSGLIAEEFNSRIERMGIHSRSITDADEMVMVSSLLKKSDLLFCFSSAGTTKSVIDSAKAANENGVYTITITNYENTLLTDYSNEVVLTPGYKYIDDEKFINSQLPSLFLLDILTYKLLNKSFFMENYHKTLNVIGSP